MYFENAIAYGEIHNKQRILSSNLWNMFFNYKKQKL